MLAWPWRRRIEVVAVADAGDDATAALTMILRYHGRSVTTSEVREAIYGERTEPPNALDVVRAAEAYRLQGRGVKLDHPSLLLRLSTPNIAHMSWASGAFPRSADDGYDGYFAVVESVTDRRVRWIHPYQGERFDVDHASFAEIATGIFLEFGEAMALPRAGLHS